MNNLLADNAGAAIGSVLILLPIESHRHSRAATSRCPGWWSPRGRPLGRPARPIDLPTLRARAHA
jgi:hypothetical protein